MKRTAKGDSGKEPPAGAPRRRAQKKDAGAAAGSAKPESAPAPRRTPRRCNALDGKRWLQNSISVWSDIRKTPEEMRLKHPALFPRMLVERLIETFLPPGGGVVLDPFTGVGSTLLAAAAAGHQGVGFELSEEFASKARRRLADQQTEFKFFPDPGRTPPATVLHQASASRLLELVPRESVDLCVTSPPYWDILNQRRTADMKAIRHYGNLQDDLGTIADYDEFLSALTRVFADVLQVLKPGGYCCIAVMDLRKKNKFFPFHSDLASRLVQAGFILDDLIIWNRQAEYNNLRPLGYPSVFRVNKVHEFIVLLQKPVAAK